MASFNVEGFIEVIKNKPILWDLNHPQYKNLKKKADVWKTISEECGLSVEVSKKKWKRLRDSYAWDKNSRKTISGQGAEDAESSWKYSQQMGFLADQLKPRTTTSNYEQLDIPQPNKNNQDQQINYGASTSTSTADDNIILEDFIIEETLFSPPETSARETEEVFSAGTSNESLTRRSTFNFEFSPPPESNTASSSSRVRRKSDRDRDIEEGLLGTMESLKDYLKRPREDPAESSEDEDEFFCKSLVLKLKKFPRPVKNKAKEVMLKYLNDVENKLDSGEIA